MSAESDRPTKASGVAQPAAVEPASKVGEKRRNRWDQSTSAECVPRAICARIAVAQAILRGRSQTTQSLLARWGRHR